MKQVRFHPEAKQELEEHESWYRERSEIAAQGFLLELDHAVTSVAESPERWPPLGPSRRQHKAYSSAKKKAR